MVVLWLVLRNLGSLIFLDGGLEGDEFFFFGAVIADADYCGVDELDDAGAFGHNLCARVADELAFDAGADDRSLAERIRGTA